MAYVKLRWVSVRIGEIERCKFEPREAWRAVRELNEMFTGHHRKVTVMKLKKSDGTLAKTDKENINIMAPHLEHNVYNRLQESAYESGVELLGQRIEVNEELGRVPDREEIKRHIMKMMNRKSPGLNGIPPEAYKLAAGTESGLDAISAMVQEYFESESYDPDAFHWISLKLLPKKGRLSDPNKWRGIALLDIGSKLISSVSAERLMLHLNEFGIDEQCGSLIHKGCTDANFGMKQMAQLLHEHQYEVHLIFVDLVKAYDTINRELLWKIMARYGVPNSLISVIQKLYRDVKIDLRIGKEKTTFGSTCGVKQGDNLAPILFIMFMNCVAESLDELWDFEQPNLQYVPDDEDGRPQGQLTKMPVKTKKGERFNFFKSYYVDDAAFILLNREDAIRATKLIVSHFKRFGLTVHTGSRSLGEGSKTEALYIPPPRKEPYTEEELLAATADITIDDDRFISYTDEFKYLGSLLEKQLDDVVDIHARIKQAKGQFQAMRENIFANKDVPLPERLRYYNALTVNTVLWGCESWALKPSLVKKLESMHHNCLRQIVGYNFHRDGKVTNEDIRAEALSAYTMETNLELRRCRWLEKVATMGENRLPRKLFGAFCHGRTRRRGKAKTTIRHGYRETLEKLGFGSRANDLSEWMPAARDPVLWAEIVEYRLGLVPGTYTKYKFRQTTISDSIFG